MISSLSIGRYLFVFNWISEKEVWETLEMIQVYFYKIEQEGIKKHIHEDETPNEYKGLVIFVDNAQTFESLGVVLKTLYLKDSIIGDRYFIQSLI